MIQIKNITKKYPSVTALDDISFVIKRQELFGLLGPNGAGKTTLMNILVGYDDSDHGDVLIEGEKVDKNNLEIRKKIGLVPQSLALYDDLSAQGNLEIFGSFYNIDKRILHERIKEKLYSVGLYERRKDNVKTYSGGMKRRLNLIASLLHDPPLILCDEPTVGIDPQSRNAIFDYLTQLNELGRTIVYTTHYMEEAERLCSRIAIIDYGKIIAEGTIDDLLKHLTYTDTILIKKNQDTVHSLGLLEQFGEIIEHETILELKPKEGFRMSELYLMMENKSMDYKNIEVNKPSLESLFLHMTGRRLRD